MGLARWNSIELVEKLFTEKVENHFKPLLLGKTIESRGEVSVEYYVETEVKIDNESYLMHFRWATDEENGEECELVEEGDYTLAEYFDEKLKGQKITEICFSSTDRDDEIYLICEVSSGDELEIPMGFDPGDEVFHNHLERILSDEDKETYHIMRDVSRAVNRYRPEINQSFAERKGIYKEILEAYNKQKEFEYEISDFYKLDKIKKIVNSEDVEAIKVISEVERIIYE